MKNIKQLRNSALLFFIQSLYKKTAHLGLCLMLCLCCNIYGEVYKIKLAKIQPYFDKVTIEYAESKNNSVSVTYNSTDTQSIDVEKIHTYKEHMHPIQALMLGCQELEVSIVNYSLDIIRQNEMQLNTSHLINKLINLRTEYEKNNYYIFTACLTGMGLVTFHLSDSDFIKLMSGISITYGIASTLVYAWNQQLSLKKIAAITNALCTYRNQ